MAAAKNSAQIKTGALFAMKNAPVYYLLRAVLQHICGFRPFVIERFERLLRFLVRAGDGSGLARVLIGGGVGHVALQLRDALLCLSDQAFQLADARLERLDRFALEPLDALFLVELRLCLTRRGDFLLSGLQKALFLEIIVVITQIFRNAVAAHLHDAVGHAVDEIAVVRDGEQRAAEIVQRALTNLSRRKVGALIVIENKTGLNDIIASGTMVDAEISSGLIENIFEPNTPLHDGAVVMRSGRITAAACFLPLSENSSISRELGTRHRAALGISETTDATVLIVSEETGTISMAHDGRLTRYLDAKALYAILAGLMKSGDEQSGARHLFTRAAGRSGKDGKAQ